MEAVDILSRWAHVFTAVVLVGGAVFQRLALLPVLKELPEEQRNSLRGQITARWARVVHVGIGVLLLTGLYNYLNATGQDALYHSLVETKILLAIAVFFIASALVGRAEAFQGMRDKAGLWIGAIILLAAVIIAIAGFVKVRRDKQATSQAHTVTSLRNVT
ncbi:MAG: hypothetical protein CMJ48_03355 [Planctomycetaceae bacterium]|nr:hypothetical protein [Planctomycetaceae bacterium]